MVTEPRGVLFFRPTLGEGGADRVTITVLKHLDRRRFRPMLALLRAEGPFVADLPPDVEVIELGARRLAYSAPALRRAVRKLRPDVLFSTCSASNVVAAVAHAIARSDARLVLSERNAIYRGRDWRHPKQWVEVQLKKLLYRRADLVTAVSRGVAGELEHDVHVDPARIAVVYNPMVEDDLAQRAAQPVEHPWFASGARIPVVVACARLVPQKDYPTLIEAFAQVLARREARLFVLGEGPLRAELEERARARLGDAVHFHGFDKNPFRYFARARLLMHASRAEGLPGSLIQAMACGAPVVSTDCDFGPREVITASGVDGFLVPVGDAAALANRALELIDDDERRARVAEAARRSVERFTTVASIARYEAAIEGAPGTW